MTVRGGFPAILHAGREFWNKCNEMNRRPKSFAESIAGFSLVELMVSIAIGLFLIAVTLTLFGSSIKSSRDVLASARLNQELNAVMQVMVDDIRRAGYSDGDQAVYSNGATADLSIPAANCIVYSYDRDDSGAIEDDEKHGFRLSGGAVDYLVSSTNAPLGTCGTGNGNSWQPLTDDDVVEVTSLVLSTLGSSCRNLGFGKGDFEVSADSQTFACDGVPSGESHPAEIATGDRTVDIRVVNIALAGRVANDPDGTYDVTKDLNVTVKVRNNRVRTH